MRDDWTLFRGAAVIAGCILGLFLFGCAGTSPKNAGANQSGDQFGYFCACGDSCECKTKSKAPGKCPCGKALISKRVLHETDTHYMICGCGDCVCTADQMKSDSTCGCGKPLVAFPKNAAYACACPEGCNCKTESQKPGKCQCNKEMTRR